MIEPCCDAVAELGIARLPDVAEQVRRQRVGRVLPRRHFLDDHVRQLEIETPRRDGRHLRERRVLHDDDRPIARLAAMAIDGRLHVRRVEAGHGRQHADRAVHVFRALADDGDPVRVPVLDEHRAVAVEQHAARRPQGERPLVVVLRHLLELLVLDDLEEPERDRQRGKHDHRADLQGHETNRNATTILGYSHG